MNGTFLFTMARSATVSGSWRSAARRRSLKTTNMDDEDDTPSARRQATVAIFNFVRVGEDVSMDKRLLGSAERLLGPTERVLGSAELVFGPTERLLGSAELVLGRTERVLGPGERVFGP